MEEVKSEGGSMQPSIAPSDLAEENAQGSSQSEDRVDVDEQQNSMYKASEIAGRFIEVIDPKTHVDTAAPIDSVKGAVSKFGGIRDWRERRVQIQDELDKVQVEMSKYQKTSKAAEQAVKELESTWSLADELRLSVEKAQAEEARARRETGESATAKAELCFVTDRRAAAVADLEAALAELQKERAAAMAEAARAREAGKAVEDLGAELVALKGELERSHAAHVEAEEKRRAVESELEQDKSQWQSELEEAEVEAKRLRDELMAACDIELKAEAALELLESLKAAVQEKEKEEKRRRKAIMVEKAEQELEDVKASIDKAKGESNHLRFAADSMRVGLERRKAELVALQRRGDLLAVSIASLEEDLNRATSALEAAEANGVDESNRLTEARREAERARQKADAAREEVGKAAVEAAVAKAGKAAVEARLEAVKREILAANASEEMATASANALQVHHHHHHHQQQQQQQQQEEKEGGESKDDVTLRREEYDELSRRAWEMEDAAGKRVMEAVKLIKEAKDAEVRSLEKLTRAAKHTEQRRQALLAATEEAEEAEFDKLSAERELRQWRADHNHNDLQQPTTPEAGTRTYSAPEPEDT
ncbi:hypothetical protein QOZ80_3BG0297210 [Eleusine coracana subsp. coracana]|nr:hypothetical protein QOZ80_3BG0297210 [Eleusine coracana subsp. coracana]